MSGQSGGPHADRLHHQQRQLDLCKRIEAFNSLDYSNFHASNKTFLREKAALFKALCHYEDQLIEELENNETEKPNKVKMGRIYAHIGHIHLLALDWIKAMSAYQRAYKLEQQGFAKDEGCLYGLGLCYFHFRLYRPAIYLFNQLAYSHPFSACASEVHARLGIAHKVLGNYQQAYRHLRIAANDAGDLRLCPRYLIRFHVAHCFDLFGEFPRAKQEYRRLLDEYANAAEEGAHGLPDDLQSAVYRQLGWISYRASIDKPANERPALIAEAESLLQRAIQIAAEHGLTALAGRASSYLGRVLSHLPSKEVHAFKHFRYSIDNEADANTWFGIGELYFQQKQPADALQAFACAVKLDPAHVSAWVSLGKLYEHHKQFKHSLDCYKEAVKHSDRPTEWLNQRIRILEKELRVAEHLLANEKDDKKREPNAAAAAPTATATTNNNNPASAAAAAAGAPAGPKRKETGNPAPNGAPAPQPPFQLYGLDEWHNLNIVSQVTQQLAENTKSFEHNYRQGSLFWQMTELTAQFYQAEPFAGAGLDATQRQILDVLKVNQDVLAAKELQLLKQLEERLPSFCGPMDDAALAAEPKPDKLGPDNNKVKTEQPDFPVLSNDDVDNLLGGASEAQQTAAESAQEQAQSALFTATDPYNAGAAGRTGADEEEEEGSDKVRLPPTLNLMADLRVPISTSAREVLDVCRRRKARQPNANVFDERCGPPKPPTPPHTKSVNLHPQVPLIYVESEKDAKTIELQNFCYKSTIALVRGLTHALKIDLAQFSTKTLIEIDADHEVEVRTQLKMPGDANLNNLGEPTWACYSAKSYTSVGRYGRYQAESFRHSLKEETEKLRNIKQTPPTQRAANGEPAPKRRKAAVAAIQAEAEAAASQIPTKIIKFGTNVDLGDEKKFMKQLKELSKMPAFCRLYSASNLLSYLDYKVLGMNTVQLYMKVPGCRTPGHLENNSFASVNINIGPGECEWFGVAWEYYPMIDKMCRERKLDFLKGAWWPNYDDLIAAGIPVYRFTQKAGDLVWVGGGCVHWVQATGWCNNIAWNVGPTTSLQVEMAVRAYEWNRLNAYRSLVPMQHLCWQVARALRFTDQRLFNLVKGVLIRSLAYARMVADFAEAATNSTIRFQSRGIRESAHYCHLCEVEVFNILFVKEVSNKFRVFCLSCARRGGLDEYTALQQYTFEELSTIFDLFQFVPSKTALIC